MLAALARHLPHARIEGVAAGLHLLITFPGLPGSTDDVELAAALRQTGVVVHPLSWHRHRPGPPGLVLGYAAHPPDRLRDAVRRLAVIVGTGAAARGAARPGAASQATERAGPWGVTWPPGKDDEPWLS